MQTVIVDGSRSSEVLVKSGVPQGTVLGPLLFLTYINDIAVDINSAVKLFADDCLLFRSIKDHNDINELQEDLDKIGKWCDLWQMSFNDDKCKRIRITNRVKTEDENVEYHIGEHEIETVNEHPYLGIQFTKKLSWGHHIDNIRSKATKTLNLVRRNFHRCPQSIKKQAYSTLVRPILEYASPCWDPYENDHIIKIEKIQNKAARFIKGDYNWSSSVTKIKNDLNLQPLQERRLIARNTQYYKCLNEESAINIPQNIRSSHAHIQTRIDTYKYSFLPRTTRCWNVIPESIRKENSATKFKEQLSKAFDDEYLKITSPRGVYNRPMLGNRATKKNK